MKTTPTVLVGCVVLAACGGDDTPMEPAGPEILVPDGLLAYFPFTADASDASGNANHGTLVAGATAAGQLGLGAAADALELPSTLLADRRDFSVAAWVQLDVIQAGSNQLLSGATVSDHNSVGIYYQAGLDRWEFQRDNDVWNFDTQSVVEDGDWHHLALTRAGASLRLYLDGIPVGGSIPATAASLDVDPGGLFIGQDQDVLGGGFDATQSLAGQVDNLRFYDRALTEAEVTLLSDEPR